MGKHYSYATSMDEFYINFTIFGKYGDFESWQKAELSIKVKKRITVYSQSNCIIQTELSK